MIFYNGDSDVVLPERRATKKDQKAKRDYNRYKRGGPLRVQKKKEKED